MKSTPLERCLGVLGSAALAVAAGCATSMPPDTAAAVGGPIGPELFPVASRASRFVLARGETRRVQVDPAGDGAVLRIEGNGGVRRLDVRREAGGLVFSGGPDSETEILRFGAAPGAEWTSGAAAVRFEGWERVVVPGGTFDAARVRSMTGPETLRIVQTWWFAPGVGIVRLRSDRGGIFTEEMSLAGE